MKMDIVTTATVAGDALTGEAKLGSFGTAQLTGTRRGTVLPFTRKRAATLADA